MQTTELRERFLGFFAEREHRRLMSSPLVPSDPTLLFTAAGMVPFKDIFWGHVAPSFERATTCQKCFRTTDIENVGRTAYHNTFFEMLGNFSFGDYFKQGAIELAWEFLTKELRVPAERLTASIYEEDDDAHAIWSDVIGLPADRIVRLGKTHNWWGPVGNTGPCGPDSEIHYDAGEELACGPECLGPACDCNRYNEIWNLVFIQYDAQEDGSLVPLARKNIDTGMGLERTTAVLQSVPSVFDIDVFAPIIEAIEAVAPGRIPEEGLRYRNLIADHLRGMPFFFAEGVMPGNERQGYVLRRLLRRAIRASERLALPERSLALLVDPVIDVMRSVYPEIVETRDLAAKLIAREEETFRRTLRDGERRLTKHIEELKADGKRILPGELAFELTDTYGFPLEMIVEIAGDEGLDVNVAGFERALDTQRERSRAQVSVSVGASLTADADVIPAGAAPTIFVGYEGVESEAIVENVLKAESGITRVVFPKSPFYAEAGGQVADTGRIENLDRQGRATVTHVSRNSKGVFLHSVSDVEGSFEKGDRCWLSVDVERRLRIERNHTATHLLHAALREVLGSHAAQAGSEVNDRELRFDFSHFEKMTDDQLARVEEIANAVVLADLEVKPEVVTLEQARESGAIGLFDDEYKGKIDLRVVSVCDEGEAAAVSKELCGGTHVRRSGEIGLIKIVSEEGIASGVRRIRAITGDGVLARLREQDAFAARMRNVLGDDPEQGVQRLKHQIAELNGRIEAAGADRVQSIAEELGGTAETVGEVRLISGRADIDAGELKELADLLEVRVRPGVVILVGDAGGRGVAVCKASKKIKAVRAGDLVRAMSGVLGGGGGGGPTFAQGGGPDPSRLDESLRLGTELAKNALSAG